MTLKKQIEKHKKQSEHYWKNANHFIEADDAEKASEFLWGTMTQALKAVAASKEISLKSHKAIRNYAIELARELKDESIKNSFYQAQSLHSNFYETGLLMEDVVISADDIRKVVDKLFGLLPERTEPTKPEE